MRATRVAAAVLLAAGCSGSTPAPDTVPVALDEVGPAGEGWTLTGARRSGQLCTTLRRADIVLGERCGEQAVSLQTWEVATVSYASTVVVFAPLPTRALRVRLDGMDGSLTVAEARTAPGFPGRFFLTEVSSTATPKTVRVFARNGRAVVPSRRPN